MADAETSARTEEERQELDLWEYLEVFPEDNKDVTALGLPPTARYPDIEGYRATRELQLNYILSKQLNEVEHLRKMALRTFDDDYCTSLHSSREIDRLNLCPPLFQMLTRKELEESQGESPGEDGNYPFQSSLMDLKRWVEKEASGGESESRTRPGISAHMLNVLYEKQYELMRMKQSRTLDEMFERQWRDGRNIMMQQNLKADRTWNYVAWEGPLEEEKQEINRKWAQSIADVQLLGRIEGTLDIPVKRIYISKTIPFDPRDTRNTDFLKRWCHEPWPKYIVRVAKPDKDQYERFYNLMAFSRGQRKAHVADLDDVPPGQKSARQMIMVPLHFVRRPLKYHPNLSKILDSSSYTFLGILYTRQGVPQGDQVLDCWGFDQYATTPLNKSDGKVPWEASSDSARFGVLESVLPHPPGQPLLAINTHGSQSAILPPPALGASSGLPNTPIGVTHLTTTLPFVATSYATPLQMASRDVPELVAPKGLTSIVAAQQSLQQQATRLESDITALEAIMRFATGPADSESQNKMKASFATKQKELESVREALQNIENGHGATSKFPPAISTASENPQLPQAMKGTAGPLSPATAPNMNSIASTLLDHLRRTGVLQPRDPRLQAQPAPPSGGTHEGHPS
ncbi:uncharacterized protein SPPG_04126 [Spizellomyces punctatus DAOM BR117]|uniref:Uncharacterized protein n=1 Tax=Spizellomyces punctatus (strain DAOM BR117) TaxID=645134 RepID=A0A0L0HJ24_SPIPD|nr:uncharacterized protein SPPG_04126 [Spizellomyces punctatus DAOM BR117]KND01033.1 hypothetical protein SPPG_04126 [Spizellomyces punctatus DAOM BR117]|eukprot:XP_016609072.1 hypothetical protein SPPG_04126 [Spizellomyces punctatus DAOM BR117]